MVVNVAVKWRSQASHVGGGEPSNSPRPFHGTEKAATVATMRHRSRLVSNPDAESRHHRERRQFVALPGLTRGALGKIEGR